MTPRRILPFEWGAVFLLAVSAALLAVLVANPFFAFPLLLVWGSVALSLVVGGVVTAVRDPLPMAQRIRTALAAPIAIGMLVLLLYLRAA